jgi:phosphoglycerate dehydrogenase-like enzyme/uncharacterized protein YbjT (DUF2867 family)
MKNTILLALLVLFAVVAPAGTQAAVDDKIIVSGASGQLGHLTVKALLAKGVPAKNLILVSRTPDTLQEYAKLGASARFGDFSKPESLPAAYKGGTRMLLISIGGGAGPRPEAHKRAIDAAKAAGVKQIAYTSWIALSKGDHGGIGADHFATEELLRKSGVPWTFLRNSVYTDIVVGQAAKMVADGRATVPEKPARVAYVTREDCAAAAAAVLTTPGHDNKVYDITGPELVGPREIAAAASEVSGKNIEVAPAAAGAAAGPSFFGPSLEVVSTAVADLTGRPATSVRTFLAANKDKLGGGAAAGGPAASPPADAPLTLAGVMEKLRIEESPTPVRERKGWRKPKKMVVIGGLDPEERSQISSIAPGMEIVTVRDVAGAAAAATNADILLGLTSYGGICEPEIIERAKELRWLDSQSAGVERCMIIPAVKSRNLLVTNMRGVDSAAIGEHAIAFALALARGLETAMVNTSRARWSREDAAATQMQVLAGKTMLVVGLGGIGTEVAKRAHGIGMKVIATRNSDRPGPDYVSHVGKPEDLLTLARTADVIVNTAPLTTETTGLFNAKFFDVLKRNALFINVARGGSVVTADLTKALMEHRLAGAGLDVVDPEPLPPNDPLWKAPNVIISPHVSGRSDLPGAERQMIMMENLRRYVAGEKMLSVVDLEREY